MKALALLAALAVAGTSAWAQEQVKPETQAQTAETKEQRDARMAWWREARFGMFIHWGLYAVPAGQWNGKPVGGIGEWIMNNGKIPVADYAKFAERFNPVKFDADAWVKVAKDAGMKYIVITSKHHDGFAMFPSKASTYNIYDATPFKRDPLKELADACRKQGIKLGFYYSQSQDWHHPGGGAYVKHWDPAQDGDYDAYLKNIAQPQVKELLTNYGPDVPAVLWWDTPVNMNAQRAEPFLELVRSHPGLITNNRLGYQSGDTETPEQFIPATGYPGRDWETCMTLNDTWGYKSDDHHWKSTDSLIRNLVDIASKGGNYLLNVGPTAEGVIPEPSIERLQQVGAWMKTNGQAIYGTTASPFKKLSWGRCTRKGDTLYLHVFNWPADGAITVPMTNTVASAHLLVDPSKAVTADAPTENGVTLHLPGAAPDPIASVIVMKVSGEVNAIQPLLQQAADGSLKLGAADAEVTGSHAKIEGGNEPNIGFWIDAKDSLSWPVSISKPGAFKVELTYACEPGAEGTEYVVKIGDHGVLGVVKPTKAWTDYATVTVGWVQIDSAGKATAELKPLRMPKYAVMNLRKVTLTPADVAAK